MNLIDAYTRNKPKPKIKIISIQTQQDVLTNTTIFRIDFDNNFAVALGLDYSIMGLNERERLTHMSYMIHSHVKQFNITPDDILYQLLDLMHKEREEIVRRNYERILERFTY